MRTTGIFKMAASILLLPFLGIVCSYLVMVLPSVVISGPIDMGLVSGSAILVAFGQYFVYMPVVAAIIVCDARGSCQAWVLRLLSPRSLAFLTVALIICVSLTALFRIEALLVGLLIFGLFSVLVLAVSFNLYRIVSRPRADRSTSVMPDQSRHRTSLPMS
jgi:hypothetical protein